MAFVLFATHLLRWDVEGAVPYKGVKLLRK